MEFRRTRSGLLVPTGPTDGRLHRPYPHRILAGPRATFMDGGVYTGGGGGGGATIALRTYGDGTSSGGNQYLYTPSMSVTAGDLVFGYAQVDIGASPTASFDGNAMTQKGVTGSFHFGTRKLVLWVIVAGATGSFQVVFDSG